MDKVIKFVNIDELDSILEKYSKNKLTSKDKALYMAFDYNAKKYVVIDNSDGNCWTEEFNNYAIAILYLISDSIDIKSLYRADKYIEESSTLLKELNKYSNDGEAKPQISKIIRMY